MIATPVRSLVSLSLGLVAACSWAADPFPPQTRPTAQQPTARAVSVGIAAAWKRAANENKHVVVLVYRADDADAQVLNVRTRLDKLATEPAWRKKALFVMLDLAHPAAADKEFIDEYGLQFAPLPLTLLFAPNGALVKHFAQRPYTDKQLAAAFAGPVRAEAMKALQDGKTVLVFVPGKDKKQNAGTLTVAREAVRDRQLGGAALITVDPSRTAAKDLFDYYSLHASVTEATVYYLFPPSRYGGQVVAPADADDLVDAVLQSLSSTGPG